MLAWVGELIQSLVAAGDFEGACLTVQKVCEAVKVDSCWASQGKCREDLAKAWLTLFAENLTEQMKASGE